MKAFSEEEPQVLLVSDWLSFAGPAVAFLPSAGRRAVDGSVSARKG